MIEIDNVGYPVSYLLMTTATAIDQQKRTKSLASWARQLRDRYDIQPVFAHTDKDMAEIGCLKEVWDPKINLCWWHLRRAVKTRLAKAKLATTPYNAGRAHHEFAFIDTSFKPACNRTDTGDFEGGVPDDGEASVRKSENTDGLARLTLKIPPRTQPVPLQTPEQTPSPEDEEDDEEGDMGTERNKRTFCPTEFRESILGMMEKHYCAHPLIPGYSEGTPGAIHRWATKQMYQFCEKYDLPEVWAYLWENWYRGGRWELWARSQHPQIPVLKTTMIVEGQ